MGETYSCTFADCDKNFSKAYELKKHRATHEDPDSVFYCSRCEFITLQRKNLMIHFATHTGEKIHQCPDIITIGPVESSARERCEYKTNDPAALTKHRKIAHGYIPPHNRGRPVNAPPALPYIPQKKGGNVLQHPRPDQRPISIPYHIPTRKFRKNNFMNSPGCKPPSTLSTTSVYSSIRQGSVGASRRPMETDSFDMSGYDSTFSSNAMLVTSSEELEWDNPYDPSLHIKWMAKYEMGYSSFDATGMKYHPEPLSVVSSSVPIGFDVRTGQEGCLCPEWMVEAGIEGWDQSVLEAHKSFYTFDA